jgi:hypothetical protein
VTWPVRCWFLKPRKLTQCQFKSQMMCPVFEKAFVCFTLHHHKHGAEPAGYSGRTLDATPPSTQRHGARIFDWDASTTSRRPYPNFPPSLSPSLPFSPLSSIPDSSHVRLGNIAVPFDPYAVHHSVLTLRALIASACGGFDLLSESVEVEPAQMQSAFRCIAICFNAAGSLRVGPLRNSESLTRSPC